VKTPHRILLLSMKAGDGHLRAAEAVQSALAERQRDYDVVHMDVLQHTSALFRAGFSSIHKMLVSHMPSIWRMLYERTEAQQTQSRFKRMAGYLQSLQTRGIRNAVLNHQPSYVICTHFTPAAAVAALRRRGEYSGQLGVVLTDYDVHPVWIHPGVDCYFVATQAMAAVLRQRGIAESQIQVTGIPVLPVFSQDYPEKRIMRRYLGLNENLPTVLISGGGGGMGGIDRTAAELARVFPETQFLAVAGHNKAAFESMRKVSAAGVANLVPLSYVRNMHELMAASDIAVSRCGGMTSSECLAMGLPMIVTNPIPGQEERNLHFLLENGAALHAQSFAHLVYKLRRVLNEGELSGRMRQAAQATARPSAAATIAAVVLENLMRVKNQMPIRLTMVQRPAPTASANEPDVATALFPNL